MVLSKFTLAGFLGAGKAAAKAFMFKIEAPEELIEKAVQLGDSARKGGFLALEDQTGGQSALNAEEQEAAEALAEAAQQRINETVKKLAEELEQQIVDGAIELESLGQQIIIRIRENGSFPSGSSFLQPRFRPIVQQIGRMLVDIPGEITVSGHTDDFQVADELHLNNWDLSAKRAVSVASELVRAPGFDRNRLMVVGHADTRPLVPNDSELNRRRNRRVEIAIMQGKPKESEPVSLEPISNPG